MREELAASSLLGNEALTSELEDKQAEALLTWATSVLPLMSVKGRVREDDFVHLREILKQVNRYYSFSPESDTLKRKKAVLDICRHLHRIAYLFDTKEVQSWNYLLDTTDETLIQKIRDKFDPGGRDE